MCPKCGGAVNGYELMQFGGWASPFKTWRCIVGHFWTQSLPDHVTVDLEVTAVDFAKKGPVTAITLSWTEQ